MKPLQQAFAILPQEFNHSDLMTALKKCSRRINPQSAIHHFRTQGLIKPIGHRVYIKILTA